MNILHHSVAKSRHSFTSRAGLMVPATLPGRLGLGETVDELMPAPGCSGSAGAGRRGTSCRRQSPSAGGSPAGPGPGDPGHRCLGDSCEEEDRKAHLQGQEGSTPMPLDDGSFSETGSAARTVHSMAGTPEAFCLAVQGKAVDRPGPAADSEPVRDACA